MSRTSALTYQSVEKGGQAPHNHHFPRRLRDLVRSQSPFSTGCYTAVLAAVFAVPGVVFAADEAMPKQPQLGFEGHLVDVSKHLPGDDGKTSLGMQVDKIKRGSPAWKMGLEKGDVIVSIDTWRFTTNKGYFQALRAAGQRPSIIIIDARSQKMVRRPCSLPHAEPSEDDLKPQKPDSFMMGITLEEDVKQDGP